LFCLLGDKHENHFSRLTKDDGLLSQRIFKEVKKANFRRVLQSTIYFLFWKRHLILKNQAKSEFHDLSLIFSDILFQFLISWNIPLGRNHWNFIEVHGRNSSKMWFTVTVSVILWISWGWFICFWIIFAGIIFEMSYHFNELWPCEI